MHVDMKAPQLRLLYAPATVTAANIMLVILAVAGMAFRGLRFFLFSVPAGFVFLNAMAANGLWHYLFASDMWQVTRDVIPPPATRHASRDQSHV